MTDVVANGNTPQKLAVRARILLLMADRVRPSHIATRLALSRNHIHYWVRRYVALGVSGVLHDAPRPGRRKRITPDKVTAIVSATLTTTPSGRFASRHKTLATMLIYRDDADKAATPRTLADVVAGTLTA